jgi:hypothetical protein
MRERKPNEMKDEKYFQVSLKAYTTFPNCVTHICQHNYNNDNHRLG